jgi:hypothetical protein
MGRNSHFPHPFCDHLMIGLAEFFVVLIDYSSCDHYPVDPGKPLHTIPGIAIHESSYCHR